MKLTIDRHYESIGINFVRPGHIFTASNGRVYLRADDCIIDLTPRDNSTDSKGVAACLVHRRDSHEFTHLTVVAHCGPLLVEIT